MPIYALTEQMSEKIKCPERDSNPRHPDLMEGALTTELPRQPRWSESIICYKGNIDYQTFAPRPLGLGIASGGRRNALFLVVGITENHIPGWKKYFVNLICT